MSCFSSPLDIRLQNYSFFFTYKEKKPKTMQKEHKEVNEKLRRGLFLSGAL